MEDHKEIKKLIRLAKGLLTSVMILITISAIGLFLAINDVDTLAFFTKKDAPDQEGNITTTQETAEEILVDDVHRELIVNNCTGCHSARLIVQNRATREGWKSMIQWMQKTQNLWDLGENESLILDYLSKNYAPNKKGRRANLSPIEWYQLETISERK